MTNKLLNTLMASVALIAVAGSLSVAKAGDYRTMGGSLKDPIMVQAPVGTGSCYLRADTGYAFSGNSDTYFFSEVTRNIGDVHPTGSLGNEDRSGSWMFEAGVGCGMGAMTNRFGISGVRLDATFGIRNNSEITGIVPGFTEGNSVRAEVTTYTQMFNLYKDFNIGMGSVTPYLGAGVGMAYHQMGNVFVDQGDFSYVVEGDEDLNLAWSLMAGVSFDVRENIKFDIGYRYTNMGAVNSNHNIVAISGADVADPYLDADMSSHELKFGLRYSAW